MLPRVRDRAWLLRQDRARRRALKDGRRRQLQFYRQFVHARGLVFDVGANTGERTDVFAALGSAVVAFEPLPQLSGALVDRFAHNPAVVVRATALGATPGIAQLRMGDESTISTMSDSWREAVTSSGRFSDHRWGEAIDVPVSTLDVEIALQGRPDFCKIDVEGFELEVLRGLSSPVPALSVEYTHEQSDVAESCLHRIAALGDYRFAFSVGESMVLWSRGWCSLAATLDGLRSLDEPLPWGDLYAVQERSAS